jgi:hypothetical protein
MSMPNATNDGRGDLQYPRVYADEAGETHFGSGETEFAPQEAFDPSHYLQSSPFTQAERFRFLWCAPNGEMDFHPAQRECFLVGVTGVWELVVSDGEVRRFEPGSVVKMEDARPNGGNGHVTRTIGDEPAILAQVQLPD